MRLSVVIPTRDTRDLTLACLQSLPSGTDLEVVVVDDAGTDDTPQAIATRFPDVRLLRTPSPLGFTGAANLGLAAATGDLVLLLNSDTEVPPDALAALLSAFAARPRLGIAGASLYYPDGRPQWSGGGAPTLRWLFGLASGLPALLGRLPFYRRLRPPAGSRATVSWLGGSRASDWQRRRRAHEGAAPGPTEPGHPATPVAWVTGAALAVRREILVQLGSPPFDPGFRFYAQDLDLCLRAGAAGWEVAVLPEFRVLHHHGATIGGSGGSGGSGGKQNHLLLWTDLLYWANRHQGRRWALRAARWMRRGAALRLAARAFLTPFQPAAERPAFRTETAALSRARSGLRVSGAGAGGREPLANSAPLV